MTLTRKEFFRQGILSLGEMVLQASSVLAPSPQPFAYESDASTELPEYFADSSKVARPDNRICLARNCGCFSCVDHCESGAIIVVIGVGIQIDTASCTGCAACEYVCPVKPKAIEMVVIQQKQQSNK